MEKIEEAAKYLIQLYYSTDYYCNRQKLQKLIIISHMVLVASDGKGLSEIPFISVSPLGLGINVISEKYYNLNLGYYDEVTEIEGIDDIYSNDDFEDDYKYNQEVLTDNYRKVLKRIFIAFGAYPRDQLTNCTKKMEIWKNYVEEAKIQDSPYFLNVDVVNKYVYKVIGRNLNIEESTEKAIEFSKKLITE